MLPGKQATILPRVKLFDRASLVKYLLRNKKIFSIVILIPYPITLDI